MSVFTLLLAFITGASSYAHQPCESKLRAKRLENQVVDHDLQPRFLQGKKGTQVPVFERITRANAKFIFTHTYDPRQPHRFGAKAIAVRDILTGRPTVWFFPTDTGRRGYNVHHRDAASEIHQEWAEIAYRWMSNLNEMAVHMKLRGLDFYVDAQESVDGYGDVIVTGSRELRERGRNRDLARGNAQVFIDRTQGFQMTAEKRHGEWVITDFEIDSSITALQIEHGTALDPVLQEELLATTLSRISKKLVGFRPPSWPDGLNWVENSAIEHRSE